METKELDLVVLAEYKGIVRQVVLSKEDLRHVKNLLITMFVSTGRNFQLLETPLDGLEIKK